MDTIAKPERPCDFGPCENRAEWHVSISARHRLAFSQLDVCGDHISLAAENVDGWPERSTQPSAGLEHVATFDHATREWVPA